MSRISTAAPKQQDDYDAIVGVVVNALADHWQVADPGPNCNGPSTGDEHIFTGKVPMFVGSYFERSTSPLSKQVRFMGQVKRSTRTKQRVLVSVPILENCSNSLLVTWLMCLVFIVTCTLEIQPALVLVRVTKVAKLWARNAECSGRLPGQLKLYE